MSTATITRNTATEKQTAFIKRLAANLAGSIEADTILTGARHLWGEGTFTKARASKVIEALLALPQPEREESTAASTDAAETPEGMHQFGGSIWKVQRSPESGRTYAKVLEESPETESGWTFTYVRGATRNLTAATLLSLEEAKAFGALYGTCCCCGRTLTNEESIAAGIGPICAEKF